MPVAARGRCRRDREQGEHRIPADAVWNGRRKADHRTSAIDLKAVRVATGDLMRSAAYHADALALRRTLADRHGVTVDLERLAVVAIAADRPEVAARLCGAAEALRAEINVRRTPRDEEALAEVVARARTELGLLLALKRAIEKVTPKDIRGWFKHCGYTHLLD